MLFTRESVHALVTHRNIVSDKAARDLGHMPRPLRESVRDIYEWFDAAGYLSRPRRRDRIRGETELHAR